MAMKAFSHILRRVKEGGFLTGFSMGGREEGTKVFHMLFANHILILCDASEERMEHLS